MSTGPAANLGISAIATYQPPWVLGNDWFEGTIPRKFVHQTGIQSRTISEEDEVALAVRVAEILQRDTGCDWRNCAGLVFASPSFIPRPVAQQYLDGEHAREERLKRAARRFAHIIKLPECPRYAINWFCSGFARAMSIAQRRLADIEPHQFPS